MARLGLAGWECTNVIAEPYVDGLSGNSFSGSGMSLESVIVRTGQGALKVSATTGLPGWWAPPITGVGDKYYRVYIRVTVLPTEGARVILGNIAANTFNLRLNTDGKLAYYQNVTLLGTSTTALNDSTNWYRVEWRMVDGTNIVILRINGFDEITASPSGIIANGSIGPRDTVGGTYTAYFDDWAEDNSDFPGEGKVVLLLPISDNARDTLWTGGAGGTTNLWDAVDNKTPLGTATET